MGQQTPQMQNHGAPCIRNIKYYENKQENGQLILSKAVGKGWKSTVLAKFTIIETPLNRSSIVLEGAKTMTTNTPSKGYLCHKSI